MLRQGYAGALLLRQTKLKSHGSVTFLADFAKVQKQLSSFVNHLQKAASAMKILLVVF